SAPGGPEPQGTEDRCAVLDVCRLVRNRSYHHGLPARGEPLPRPDREPVDQHDRGGVRFVHSGAVRPPPGRRRGITTRGPRAATGRSLTFVFPGTPVRPGAYME